jgi:hypothetical protein
VHPACVPRRDGGEVRKVILMNEVLNPYGLAQLGDKNFIRLFNRLSLGTPFTPYSRQPTDTDLLSPRIDGTESQTEDELNSEPGVCQELLTDPF